MRRARRSPRLTANALRVRRSTAASRRNHIGEGVLKQTIAICAGVARTCGLGTGLGATRPANCLSRRRLSGRGLPPHEVVAIVRSTGLEPLSSPDAAWPGLRAARGRSGRPGDAGRGRCAARAHRCTGGAADGCRITPCRWCRPPYGRPPGRIAWCRTATARIRRGSAPAAMAGRRPDRAATAGSGAAPGCGPRRGRARAAQAPPPCRDRGPAGRGRCLG